MANVMLCFPNSVNTAGLGGGQWSETMPLDNARDPLLGVRSRSVDHDPTSTVIEVHLAEVNPVQALALIDHNLSVIAQYRITASDDADFSTVAYQSDWGDLWSVVYPYGALPWEHPNFWTGRPRDQDLQGWRLDLIHTLPKSLLCRHWRIEINDAANAAGFVEFGRLFIGGGWQPQYNQSYGGERGFVVNTDVTETMSGAETFDIRPSRRVVRFRLDWLSDAEAVSLFDMQRAVQTHGEVLYIYDPVDVINRARHSFLGRLRKLPLIEHARFNNSNIPFEIVEVI